MDPRLLAVAASRGGVFATRHAAACGVHNRQLTRGVARGEVVRVRTDAYVVGEVWRAAMRDEQAVLRARAVLLSCGPGYAAGSVSSLALHGLPVWGADADLVHVVGPVARGRTRSGMRIEPMAEGSTALVGGWRCVRPEIAVIDAACGSGLVTAVVAGDAALHRGIITSEDLRLAIEARLAAGSASPPARPPRHSKRLAALRDRVDSRSESPGESRLRMLMSDLGFRSRSQVEIRDGDDFVARVDFLVAGRVVVEFDGLVKYEGADGKLALAREKAREERLVRLGFVVVRFVWADLDHPDRVRRALARAVAQVSAA